MNIEVAKQSPGQSFGTFNKRVCSLPKPSATEEIELITLAQSGDKRALDLLVIQNQRLIYKIATELSGYGMCIEDMVQEGTIGLLKAIKNFDITKSLRLSTFSVMYIRAGMFEFMFKNKRIINLGTTSENRKMFFKYRKYKQNCESLSEVVAEKFAEDMNATIEQVRQFEIIMNGCDHSLSPSDDEDEGSYSYILDEMISDDCDPCNELSSEEEVVVADYVISEGLKKLTDRERDIVVSRWLSGDKTPLSELAKKYNVSIERIRQVETIAFQKMKAVTQ